MIFPDTLTHTRPTFIGKMMSNEQLCGDIVQYVNMHHGRTLSKEERLDVLAMHASLRTNNELGVSEKIAGMLLRKRGLVQQVWSEFKTEKK